jgi:hypothetical protein
MSPYRLAARILQGESLRWGVTRKVKLFVKYVLPLFAPDRLEEMRAWGRYRRELRKYDREIEELLLDPRFPIVALRKPLPVPPHSPIRRVWE